MMMMMDVHEIAGAWRHKRTVEYSSPLGLGYRAYSYTQTTDEHDWFVVYMLMDWRAWEAEIPIRTGSRHL